MGVSKVAHESQIQAKVRAEIKKLGWITVKFNADAYNGGAGFPDLICLGPGGTLVLLELKKPDGRVSKIQKWWHDQLRGLGHRVHVVTTVEQAIDACKEE